MADTFLKLIYYLVKITHYMVCTCTYSSLSLSLSLILFPLSTNLPDLSSLPPPLPLQRGVVWQYDGHYSC